MGVFWENKIKAFLHDPPDKVLILFHISHETKRDNILNLIGLNYNTKLNTADNLASAMQRLYIPKEYRMDNASSCKDHICLKGDFKPLFKHTLSGENEIFKEIEDFIANSNYEKAIDKYGFDIKSIEAFVDKNDWKKTYLMIWRLLPEKYPLGYLLPADTRIPDHSIWDHLDVTSAISACLNNLGLLAVKIPAVQEFISHSRKLSDLWAASHIYSSLIFEGIKVIVDELGPDAIIYPQLRGNPLFDQYLREKFSINVNVDDKLTIANLPNVFISFVPWNKAEDIEEKCRNAIKDKLREFSKISKDSLRDVGVDFDEKLWDQQIEKAINISIAWLEFLNFDRYSRIKESLQENLKERQERWLNIIEKPEWTNYGHFYYLVYELLLMVLAQNSRLFDYWEELGEGKKCLMCGMRYSLIDENKLKNTRYANLLKKRERLCAICTIKRNYKEIFNRVFNSEAPKFESVVEIAGRKFIEKIKSDEDFARLIERDIELIYEHEWEAKEKKDSIDELILETGKSRDKLKEKLKNFSEKFGFPKKYYAILMMDGDNVGKMLSGETLPPFCDFLHPAFKNKIKEWDNVKNLNMKRVLSPSIHIAISRAMKDFSIYKVPAVVKKYDGLLVYAGGDDILALFPTDKVLDAAKELQEFFKKDFYQVEVNGNEKSVMGLGKYASISGGIIFAHYKYPLYDVLEKAREAVKSSKNKYGRNAFYLTFIKHSGEVISAGGKWDAVEDLNYISRAISEGKISHRFIYDFLDRLKILMQDEEMLNSEIKRLLERRKSKDTSNELVSEIHGKIVCLIKKYKDQQLCIKDIGGTMKILYDAIRGE